MKVLIEQILGKITEGQRTHAFIILIDIAKFPVEVKSNIYSHQLGINDLAPLSFQPRPVTLSILFEQPGGWMAESQFALTLLIRGEGNSISHVPLNSPAKFLFLFFLIDLWQSCSC